MALQQKRACSACHSAKVKCIRVDGNSVCKRCERLGLKCSEHVSRQGQGTRRRKKVKGVQNEDNVDEALAITSSLSPPRTNNNNVPPFRPSQSVNVNDCGGPLPMMCPSSMGCPSTSNHKNKGSNNVTQIELCSGMDSLEVEDNVMCQSIRSMGKDHFGLNYLVREWIALAFSRRSFDLLARASFICAKVGISMDDVISNQSPFAAATDSEPMEFLSRDILLSKSERKTIGYPIDLREVPWDLLEAVHIDPNQPSESVRNRWVAMRWTSQGISRFWASPLFSRDLATEEECARVYERNSGDFEVIDLFLPKSEKGKFGQGIFNLLFVNNKPHMDCFVVKNRIKVLKRNCKEPIEVNLIQTMKVIDLDSMIHYFEIQFLDRKVEHVMGNTTSSMNKREHVDVFVDNVNDDPIMDDIEFADIAMTDEMEEFLKLISGD